MSIDGTFSKGPSPLPLINTDYILAKGGKKTTNSWISIDTKRKFSRGTRLSTKTDIVIIFLSLHEQPALTVKNKDVGSRKRSRSEATEMASKQTTTPPLYLATPGWNRAVFTVVGKVWDFCSTIAFRGFSAGGGNAIRSRLTCASGVK